MKFSIRLSLQLCHQMEGRRLKQGHTQVGHHALRLCIGSTLNSVLCKQRQETQFLNLIWEGQVQSNLKAHTMLGGLNTMWGQNWLTGKVAKSWKIPVHWELPGPNLSKRHTQSTTQCCRTSVLSNYTRVLLLNCWTEREKQLARVMLALVWDMSISSQLYSSKM